MIKSTEKQGKKREQVNTTYGLICEDWFSMLLLANEVVADAASNDDGGVVGKVNNPLDAVVAKVLADVVIVVARTAAAAGVVVVATTVEFIWFCKIVEELLAAVNGADVEEATGVDNVSLTKFVVAVTVGANKVVDVAKVVNSGFVVKAVAAAAVVGGVVATRLFVLLLWLSIPLFVASISLSVRSLRDCNIFSLIIASINDYRNKKRIHIHRAYWLKVYMGDILFIN
ncbi:hypothetical protein FF38_03966 [Lucilia cuprina]|uniref:Transmembrane protein n=1 Tax=Lucilia cuprina TaxID=7375 RepID=A0A0L0CD35_LUCCU|nr:hypothetical protein FF38_03966 [Lucilia cuprina]